MDILSVVYMLASFWAVVGKPYESSSEFYRYTVEKELLQQGIHLLRRKLVSCLTDQPEPLRNKRQLAIHRAQIVKLSLDVSVMKNTRDYLMTQLVKCYVKKGTTNKGMSRQADQQSIPPAKSENMYLQGASNANVGYRRTHKPKVPFLSRLSDKTGKDTFPRAKAITQKVAKQDHFVVQGRDISCEKFKHLKHRNTFICRDLKVDSYWRLPNRDVCHYNYHSERWRSVSEVHRNTLETTDLKSFCTAIARVLGLKGYLHDVKVNWGCDYTKERLLWQDGHWAGVTDDNGYLRDLQCHFV